MTKLRILVVDDDPTIGVLLAELIEEMGHEVCGIEATELGAVSTALRVVPDLMIVDAKLGGGGSGVSAVESVLQTKSIPHVFMSGSRSALNKTDATVLMKPFLADELACAIARAVPNQDIDPIC